MHIQILNIRSTTTYVKKRIPLIAKQEQTKSTLEDHQTSYHDVFHHMTLSAPTQNESIIPLKERTCVIIMFSKKPLSRCEFNHIHQLEHISLLPQKMQALWGLPQGLHNSLSNM